MLKFHNTLTNQLEEFQPLNGNEVRLYICGPTVWSFAHIGNFRTFTFGDVLRRYLKYKGYELTHVFNLTDVDDRIINEAKKAGKSIDEFTAPFIEAFWEDFDALGLERPEITPRATHHIAEMIAIIEKLLENGHAYESEGSIYYRILAFPDYGKLSRRAELIRTNTTRKTLTISRSGNWLTRMNQPVGTLRSGAVVRAGTSNVRRWQ